MMHLDQWPAPALRAPECRDAINRGDRVVIAAIKHPPSPLRTGTFTVPVETTIEHFLNLHAPEMEEELENIDPALTFLNNAASAFRTTIEKIRDLPADERAESGSAAANDIGPRRVPPPRVRGTIP